MQEAAASLSVPSRACGSKLGSGQADMQRGDNFSLARPGRNVNTDGGVGSLGLPEICPSWSTHRRVGLTGVFPDKLPLECGLAIAVAAEGQAGLDWAVL